MKFLLFSDNHRDRDIVKTVIEKHPNMDHYISLGDSEMREHELTELGVYGVRGNYPFEPKFPNELMFEFMGLKMYLTHGHHHSVKLGLSRLLNYGAYNDINIICFGHTHKYLIKDIDDILFINPGALSRRKMYAKASYALLEITEKEIHVIIQNIEDEILMEYHKER